MAYDLSKLRNLLLGNSSQAQLQKSRPNHGLRYSLIGILVSLALGISIGYKSRTPVQKLVIPKAFMMPLTGKWLTMSIPPKFYMVKLGPEVPTDCLLPKEALSVFHLGKTPVLAMNDLTFQEYRFIKQSLESRTAPPKLIDARSPKPLPFCGHSQKVHYDP